MANYYVFKKAGNNWLWVPGPETSPNGSFEADTGDDANGLAAINQNYSGDYFSVDVTDMAITRETIQTVSDSDPLTTTDL